MRYLLTCCALLLLAAAPSPADDEDVLLLPIGDPERKDRTVELVLDAISDAASGDLLTPAELPARLAGVRLLFVGESHTSMDFHRTQLRVIEELQEAGRRVMIGLEMYPFTAQEHLESWGGGLLTEEGFVELSDWYENWGYHWNYYREIFLYAQRKGIPLYALNTPREIIKAVREKGFDELSEEEAERIPEQIDTDSEEHFRLFKAFFAGEEDAFHAMMGDEQWRGMFNAQCTWDATMGHNSVRALQDAGAADDPRSIMVVLIGSGHVAYGLGIQRQARQWFDGGMASIIPIPVADEEGEPVIAVQASYADFVWGLPPVTDDLYPGLGLSTKKDEESGLRRVIYIGEGSVAEKAGFEMGDILLSMNGIELPDRRTANRLTAGLRWGDSAVYEVRRGEETVTLTAFFRREPPDPCETP